MKFLAEFMIAPVLVFARFPFKTLGVPFPPGGVGDFSHQGGGERTILVPKEIKTHRVETVSEGAQVSDDGDGSGYLPVELIGHGLPYRIGKVGNFPAMIIGPMKTAQV